MDHSETGNYPVAWDKDGPIEVEMLGAQPVGETVITGLEKKNALDIEYYEDEEPKPCSTTNLLPGGV